MVVEVVESSNNRQDNPRYSGHVFCHDNPRYLGHVFCQCHHHRISFCQGNRKERTEFPKAEMERLKINHNKIRNKVELGPKVSLFSITFVWFRLTSMTIPFYSPYIPFSFLHFILTLPPRTPTPKMCRSISIIFDTSHLNPYLIEIDRLF